MKKTIIQCITAILCTVLVGVSCSNGIEKIADAKKEAAEKQPTISQTSSDVSDNNSSAPSDNTDAAPSDSTDATPTDSTDATPSDSTDSTPGDATDSKPADGDATGSTAPSSKADIIKYYNTAMNKVVSSKAGYTKVRHTDLGQLEGAEAIMKIKVAADAVKSFLGVGDTKYVNKKGEAKFLSQASLTEADVVDAKCTDNGGIYTITLTLADGTSKADGSTKTDNASLKRSGLSVGNDDKDIYDYKSAVNIYLGLNNADGASVQAVSEKTSKTTITIKVDSKTGNISSLDASWHWDAELTKVKYVVTVSGIGHADTSVKITDFQY